MNIEERRKELNDYISPDWYIENYEYWDKQFQKLERIDQGLDKVLIEAVVMKKNESTES